MCSAGLLPQMRMTKNKTPRKLISVLRDATSGEIKDMRKKHILFFGQNRAGEIQAGQVLNKGSDREWIIGWKRIV